MVRYERRYSKGWKRDPRWRKENIEKDLMTRDIVELFNGKTKLKNQDDNKYKTLKEECLELDERSSKHNISLLNKRLKELTGNKDKNSNHHKR